MKIGLTYKSYISLIIPLLLYVSVSLGAVQGKIDTGEHSTACHPQPSGATNIRDCTDDFSYDEIVEVILGWKASAVMINGNSLHLRDLEEPNRYQSSFDYYFVAETLLEELKVPESGVYKYSDEDKQKYKTSSNIRVVCLGMKIISMVHTDITDKEIFIGSLLAQPENLPLNERAPFEYSEHRVRGAGSFALSLASSLAPTLPLKLAPYPSSVPFYKSRGFVDYKEGLADEHMILNVEKGRTLRTKYPIQ